MYPVMLSVGSAQWKQHSIKTLIHIPVGIHIARGRLLLLALPGNFGANVEKLPRTRREPRIVDYRECNGFRDAGILVGVIARYEAINEQRIFTNGQSVVKRSQERIII